MRIIIFLIVMSCAAGCSVPNDDCWSTTPMTNNPNVINQRGDCAIPGMCR